MLHAVIMAGGSGTRFWPASRVARPKQLLPLATTRTSRSLLAATVDRVSSLVPPERVLVVTAAHLADATRAELPSLPVGNVLAEPAPRNTAPCVGWATRTLLARDPDAVVAVLPSDHHVADLPAFVAAIERAVDATKERALVTVGIRPSRPETGFGYIELGAPIDRAPGAHDVVRFVEKPDEARARAFVESGRFVWNGGMFFFRARAMNDAIAAHLPALASGLDAIAGDPSSLARVFPTLPSISIDYGVVEKLAARPGSIAVVPADFGWSDVGSWQSAWELAEKDAHANALAEGAIAIDAKGNLVRATKGKTVALIGVDDLVVVETDDAILVMPRSRSQDVRLVVEALKSSGRSDRT